MPVSSELGEKLLEVHRRLIAAYGDHPHRLRLAPVDELVCTILSQNTNDVNRDVAFDRLKARFPEWVAARDAPVAQVEEAIRPAGLAGQKAPAIQRALQAITRERGEISLDFLEDLPLSAARDWLTSIKGVGPKTAAIVLLFAFDRPAFPVDTHVHRVSHRLGLIGPRVSRERAHGVLEALAPPKTFYTLHLNMITHGRRICQARQPKCEDCSLRDLCDDFAERQTGA